MVVDLSQVLVQLVVSEQLHTVLVLLVGGKGFSFAFFKCYVVLSGNCSANVLVIALFLTVFVENGLFDSLFAHLFWRQL